MSDITYDFGLIQGLVDSMKARVAALDAKNNDLGQNIHVLDASWTDGSARDQMTQAFTSLRQNINHLKEIVTDIGSAVQQGHDDMHSTESALTNSWGHH